VIVETAELKVIPGPVTLVDGGFDPIHPGHVAYFEAAAGLGRPVLCNVSDDAWVGRKHPPLLPQADRAAVIDAIRFVSWTHLSSIPTSAVLGLLRPACYAKGADWRGRLPDDETAVCGQLGIEIVFLDTVRDSSSAILARFRTGWPS
jgi:bifunctional ADP-heptose synthase (sugar kinase/adenylyltransferase)